MTILGTSPTCRERKCSIGTSSLLSNRPQAFCSMSLCPPSPRPLCRWGLSPLRSSPGSACVAGPGQRDPGLAPIKSQPVRYSNSLSGCRLHKLDTNSCRPPSGRCYRYRHGRIPPRRSGCRPGRGVGARHGHEPCPKARQPTVGPWGRRCNASVEYQSTTKFTSANLFAFSVPLPLNP